MAHSAISRMIHIGTPNVSTNPLHCIASWIFWNCFKSLSSENILLRGSFDGVDVLSLFLHFGRDGLSIKSGDALLLLLFVDVTENAMIADACSEMKTPTVSLQTSHRLQEKATVRRFNSSENEGKVSFQITTVTGRWNIVNTIWRNPSYPRKCTGASYPIPSHTL